MGFAQPTNRLTILIPPASYAWSRRAQTHHRHGTALHICFVANYFVSFLWPLRVRLRFMDVCWWRERGLYVYSFRCCVGDMRTSHRLTALNGFFCKLSFAANCLDWCIFFFFFCVEKQYSSLFLLFFFLHVRRYAGLTP